MGKLAILRKGNGEGAVAGRVCASDRGKGLIGKVRGKWGGISGRKVCTRGKVLGG